VSAVALVVIAKAPEPGRSKTRLCPPCTPEQAAVLAEAALRDTLDAVAAAPARRRIVALEGEPGAWLPPGIELVAQRGDGLGQRLGHALQAADGPALVVGMDTPQLTPGLLALAGRTLARPRTDAVLGPALDGGYWIIGLNRPDPAVFEGVPMSRADTCHAQRRRLRQLGLRTADLPPLRDVDEIADARAVAGAWPGTRFSRALDRLVTGLSDAPDGHQAVPVAASRRGVERPDRAGQAGRR
jgi:rSAM/selenodomain-associated transferase 1